MDQPLITIATVTYNAETTLPATLESVRTQTYPKIEHLIIDGCSRDKTCQLVQRYVEQNTHEAIPHHIRLVREPDHGLYDAMNKAIQNAQGEYIVFLNSGDRLHSPDTIQTIVDTANWSKGYANNPAVLYGQTNIVDAEGRYLRPRHHQAPEQLTWQSFAQGMLVCHQSFYVRKDFAQGIPYNLSYRYSADYDWCIRIMKLASRKHIPIVNTHAILTDYLSEGLTTKHHRASLIERMQIMAQYYGWSSTILNHIRFALRRLIPHKA